MPAVVVIDNPINVDISTHQDFRPSDQLSEEALIFYTDGSKRYGGVGAGVYGPSCELYEPLGSTPSIFQAEIYALELCARHCLQREDLDGRAVFILSDSQAALRAISSTSFSSRLVFSCYAILTDLATICDLSLGWVPGHCGIPGNIRADSLAKAGASLPFIGPEPFCGLGSSNLKVRLLDWLNREKENNLCSLPSSSLSRKFINNDNNKTKLITRLSRNDLRLLTGHCPLKYFLWKIGRSSDKTCRFCNAADEFSGHLPCDCWAVARTRLMHFGSGFITPDAVPALPIQEIVNFMKKLLQIQST